LAALVDATLIRVLLVPALMRLAGDRNWWPGSAMPQKAAGNDQKPAGSA
jgi:RND superfamily putative drug exporter